tara:strand:+ start:650 stop:1048 length:399 start_codon:yes stop_codon:yes gene_type:complete
MAIRYKLNQNMLHVNGDIMSSVDSITKIMDDGTITCIPKCESNSDYQEYLEWAKTNKIESADVKTTTWDDIRQIRDGILKDTDWTMTTGASVDQAQWAAYRQVIRDIPQTYKDKTPSDVVWPTQPSTKGPNS